MSVRIKTSSASFDRKEIVPSDMEQRAIRIFFFVCFLISISGVGILLLLEMLKHGIMHMAIEVFFTGEENMKGKIKRRIGVLVLTAVICVTGLPAAVGAKPSLEHGTAQELITEDMLDLTPPADYTINQDMQADASEGLYNRYFLEDSIQTVRVQMDENNLNYMLQNAMDKPSVMTESVTIGDQTIGYAGIKTKGNYTLEHAFTDNGGSDRFSFTLNFGKYIKKKDYGAKQNFYGCSKISFNNFFFDKSMMKEFFALKLMSEMGIPTPQYGLAKLCINDEYYGVYFMVEAMDFSILEQYYQVDDKELSSYLTKPEDTTLLYEELSEDDSPLWEADPETYADVQDMLPTAMDWVKRLNQLSEGKDFSDSEIDVNSEEYLELLGQILDVDEVVRYFAVHSFLAQMDNMFEAHRNYGLYISQDGKALIIPWDYDLSFGCYWPCDSESTANYNIDVMFKDERANEMDRESICKRYEKYPLFHVIYQNDELLEQYHSYLKDCTKIAALGGTTDSGENYEPGFFDSYITAFEDELYDAAEEELAAHNYYMNGASQPDGVKTALPNLAKIIAMRSVGVWSQVEGWDTTVCGKGCNLSTLGNAIEGWTASGGNITTVDAATGIYATADYGKGGRMGISPALNVKILDSSEDYYQRIAKKIGCGSNDSLVVYSLKTIGSPTGDYTIHIPLSQAYAKAEGEISFYSYADGELCELTMSASDNIYTGTAEKLKYIAVVQKGGNDLQMNASAVSSSGFSVSGIVTGIAVAAAAIILVAIVVVVVVSVRKKSMNHGGKR